MNQQQLTALATIVLILLYNQTQQQQTFAFYVLYEAWLADYALVLNALINRRRARRRFHRMRIAPYAWRINRPQESCFDVYYNDLTVPDSTFKELLRVNRATFDVILNILGPRLQRQNSIFRDCIPPSTVLAIGIYRLAHGNSYVSIAPAFCVGRTTVIEAVQDVVNSLYDIRKEYIKFPETVAEVQASIETFTDLSDLPNIVGAIDGSHIRIRAPAESSADYFSRYQQHDFIIQGIVNGRRLFIDFACGFPGSMHDSRVRRCSDVYRNAENRNILTEPVENINGEEIGPYLVGDSAYTLGPWLIKPYPEGTRDPDEILFNKNLSSARIQVECAFGILKSRWRILQNRFDSRIAFAIKCTVACAVLHNICIQNGDDWDEEFEHDDANYQSPGANVLRDGEDIREKLKDYLANI
ncbi:protein ANTAGONIST OF LIKE HETEROCHROMATIN PROTEIN 1-like [Exaiptasia diaphana]|uniref:DDE Tnp4 domain-containing protein n=1 Tax=Exaiptasia diaphana TaxID=2652724 RepID=A0A913XNT3_EXADI|nr:protein ANTAGONIST OF LIKE HETEROCHROMATIN PROTEIN 1-like [Exaiptasia diaphana]